MKMLFVRQWFTLAGAILLPGVAIAQEKTPYHIPQFEGNFRLDGIPNEPGWKMIPALPVVMFSPVNGAAPSERTEFRVAYDDHYFYAAGWFYDRNAKDIQSYSFKRDDVAASDWFGLNLDTFADKENALVFYTTPTANRFDGANSNDAQGDNWVGSSWNTFWYCATSRTSEGWFAEYRIPLSSLRYQEVNGKVVMGMALNRKIARKNEYDTYPAVSNQWGSTGMFKASQAQPIVFTNLHPRKQVYVTPYLLAGLTSMQKLSNGNQSYRLKSDPTFNAGLDLKVGLTSNLTADLTLNTDFAQVEADDQQANLTRFSIFYPEKRLFFQERASIFSFGFGANNSLFYSRQIGLANNERIPILLGGRLVGRFGRWDVGFLAMQTKLTTLSYGQSFSSENMSVSRIRRRIFNQNSYIGAMTTARISTNGNYNFAYGIDGIFRVIRQNFLSFNWAQTFESKPNDERNRFGNSRWHLQYEKRILKNFGYDLSISRAGKSYNPGLGFESRHNFTRFGDRIFWAHLSGEKSVLLNHQISIYGYIYLRNQTNTTESAELSPSWDAAFKKGQILQIKWRNTFESTSDTLPLSEKVRINPGKYQFQSMYALFATPDNLPLKVRLEIEGGQFYTGHKLSLSQRSSWRLSRYLELSSYLQWNRIWLPTGMQHTDVTICQMRLRLSLNVKISAETLVQYNTSQHQISSNVRFRYNPKEGNDFYVVFNKGTNTDRFRVELVLARLSSRTVILKYSYTFLKR